MPFSSPSLSARGNIRRCAVIVPPVRDFYFTLHRFSSLGAHGVAELLARSGMAVDFHNFPLMNPRGNVLPIPPDMAYLKPFIMENEVGKLSFFTHYRHFGPSIDTCTDAILANDPEICFFSVFAFCYADSAIALAGEIRKRAPRLPLVAGGAGPSACPKYFLSRDSFDYVLTGEAEVSLMPFIKAVNQTRPESRKNDRAFQNVPNLFRGENGNVRSSGLTATTGSSDMEFFIVKSAESSKSITLSTMFSRGCPRACTFCSSRLTFGSHFRSVPIGKIEKALSSIAEPDAKKQVVINIEDDNFLADRFFFETAIALFKKRFPGVRFIAENGIDHTFLTPGTCQWLLNLGMTKFNFSLGSIIPETLYLNKRRINLEQYENSVAFLCNQHIPSITYFICGFKEDTGESILRNLAYLANKPTLTGISLFYAVPGMPGFTDTALFDDKPSSYCCGSSAYPWNDSLSTETMVTAFRLSRFINLLKSGPLSETDKNLVDLIIEKRELHTVIKNKKGNEKTVVVENQDRNLVKRYFENIQSVSKGEKSLFRNPLN